jgi:hypothetical protein
MVDRPLDPNLCSETHWNGYGYPLKQCSRRVSVTRDGKGYCKQHDPEEIKKRFEHDPDFKVER